MKKLLTIAFIVTILSACGGELKYQDKASADKAPSTERSAVEHATVEKTEAMDKQTADKDEDTAEPTATESKTNPAIKMIQGLARSMY